MTQTDGRRYSDEELALIVERASELQDKAGEAGVSGLPQRAAVPSVDAGLTLQTVREIAEEVGVQSRFVDAAAASLADDSKRTGLSDVLGGPTHLQVRSVFERQLAESERAELLDVIRRHEDHVGATRGVLGSVEWHSVGRLTGTTVAVDGSDGTVEVRVRTEASGLAAFTWIGSIAAGLVAGGVVAGALQPASMIGIAGLLGAGGLFGAAVARSLWSRAAQVLRNRALRLRDEVGQFLSR